MSNRKAERRKKKLVEKEKWQAEKRSRRQAKMREEAAKLQRSQVAKSKPAARPQPGRLETMRFPDLLKTGSARQECEAYLQQRSEFIEHCVKCLVKVFPVVDQASGKTGEPHHVTVVMLTRHVIECLDAISVLVSKGCVPPCEPELRSALEAYLGVLYILQADSKQPERT